MNDDVLLSLKPNVAFEPLIGHWYAWTYIVAPHTAGAYFRNYYLPMMDSFVRNPEAHVDALCDPAAAGGPFIALPPSRAAEVGRVRQQMLDEERPLLEFADAVRALDRLLTNEAVGGCLHGLYARVPDPLRGLVELCYDLHCRPSFRFIDASVFHSPYYRDCSQSILLAPQGDARPFVFSTPRLDTNGGIRLTIPFRSDVVDRIASTRLQPRPQVEVAELFEGIDHAAGWRDLFDAVNGRAPNSDSEYTGRGLRLRYCSHACVLVQSRGVSVLLDPLIPYRADHTARDRFSFDDLPSRINGVFITHNHQDHVMLETLLQLRHRIETIYVPKSAGRLPDISVKHLLRAIGFQHVEEIDEYDTVRLGPIAVTGLPFFGEHADLDIRTKLAYCVAADDRSVVCVADANNIEPKIYEYVREAIGEPDVLCLGMECDGAPLSWLYGPLLPRPLPRALDQSRRTESSDYPMAAQMVETLRPKRVFIYAMGLEPWLTFVTSAHFDQNSRPIAESDRLIAECRRRGIDACRLFGKAELTLG